MKDSPLVSINCISFNHEKFIKQCLDGFVMQKTNFTFEVLIHDDASTDNTAQIIKEYQTNYPEIIIPILQNENQYSKGVDIWSTYQYPRTKGKYIAICEGDDYWTDPYKLQKQVDILENNINISMCIHNVLTYDGINYKEFYKYTKTVYSSKDLINNWIVPTCSVLFNKDAISDFANDEIKRFINQDYLLFTHISLKGDIYCINENMGVYRIHPGGMTSSLLKTNKSQNIFLEQIDYMINKYPEIQLLLEVQFTRTCTMFFYHALSNRQYNYAFSLLKKAICRNYKIFITKTFDIIVNKIIRLTKKTCY